MKPIVKVKTPIYREDDIELDSKSRPRPKYEMINFIKTEIFTLPNFQIPHILKHTKLPEDSIKI